MAGCDEELLVMQGVQGSEADCEIALRTGQPR